jgi:hypothetical protein
MTTETPASLPSWYCAIGGRRRGPLEARELKELAARGDLTPDDLVWRDDFPNWVKAATVKGLFSNSLGPSGPDRPAAEAAAASPPGVMARGAAAAAAQADRSLESQATGSGGGQSDLVPVLLERLVANTHRLERIRNLDEYTITEWLGIIARIFVASLLFQLLLLLLVGAFVALVVMPVLRS